MCHLDRKRAEGLQDPGEKVQAMIAILDLPHHIPTGRPVKDALGAILDRL